MENQRLCVMNGLFVSVCVFCFIFSSVSLTFFWFYFHVCTCMCVMCHCCTYCKYIIWPVIVLPKLLLAVMLQWLYLGRWRSSSSRSVCLWGSPWAGTNRYRRRTKPMIPYTHFLLVCVISLVRCLMDVCIHQPIPFYYYEIVLNYPH